MFVCVTCLFIVKWMLVPTGEGAVQTEAERERGGGTGEWGSGLREILRCTGTAVPPQCESQDTLSAAIQHHTLIHYAGGEEMTIVDMIKENRRGKEDAVSVSSYGSGTKTYRFL